ncbi:hypothetical protein MLD38_037044 [Melastoma candidum]|uniref:Uncharacterized protein n=1 Tax=Melastoma candidum TaxID=119954 RepID=A0ACB9LL40_9MYRT|nr:hypothetical protein MLD38_037044 [Melastoma candidum]
MPDDDNLLTPAVAGGGGGGVMHRQMTAAAAASHALEPLRCPRCDSSNTKFCYYNNYSLSQPRHFCKSCKRYWTRGGTLRNVPVGGSCRKKKRIAKRSAPAASTGASVSRSVAGSKPLKLSSYGNPQEVDLAHASQGFSLPPLMPGSVGSDFLQDFVVPSSNLVIPGYAAPSEFAPSMALEGVPGMTSSLLASTIIQEQQRSLAAGGLGFKDASGIRNCLKPSENLRAEFAVGHPGVVNWSLPCQTQIHQLEPSELTSSLCWNTITNSTIGPWLPELGSNNVGCSSVPSLI